MPKFRKVPVIIDATRLEERIEIPTLEGTMVGEIGDWLITGVNNEQYPCKDDIFRKTYEPAESAASRMLFADRDDHVVILTTNSGETLTYQDGVLIPKKPV